jgi:hypothetical protein
VLPLDGCVIELMMISSDGAYRVHATHAQVSLRPTKHCDQVEVRLGTNERHRVPVLEPVSY